MPISRHGSKQYKMQVKGGLGQLQEISFQVDKNPEIAAEWIHLILK